jgi:hypothetical protein
MISVGLPWLTIYVLEAVTGQGLTQIASHEDTWLHILEPIRKRQGTLLPRNGTMVEALEAVVKHAIAQVLPVFPELRALESSVQLLIVCSHQIVAKSHQSGQAEFQVFVGTFHNIDHPVL